jgi:arginine/ornithine transport system substrate-binding protein
MPSSDEVYLDLAAGRMDAAWATLWRMDGGFLKKPQGKGYGFFGPAYNDQVLRLRRRHRGAQGRHRPAGTLQRRHPAIRANGVYKKIQDKYFDFDVYTESAR